MVRDKVYKEFNVGDEVYSEKKTWKAISANKPYIVLACYKPDGYVDDYPVRVIEVKTDIGFISRYATDKFHKTETQIRQDKINEILNDNTTI
jgi:hypothetical protein